MEGTFINENTTNYVRWGVVELFFVCVLMTFTLYLTVIGINHGITEGNSIAEYSFVHFGYLATGIIEVVLMIMIFFIISSLSHWMSASWLLIVVFGFFILLFSFDAYHDIIVLSSFGVI